MKDQKKTSKRTKRIPRYMRPEEKKEEYREPEVMWEDGMPYIMLGNTPYALDDDLKTIDYALTKVLRETLDKKV